MFNKELLLAGAPRSEWPDELSDTGFWLKVGSNDYGMGFTAVAPYGSVSRIPDWYANYRASPLRYLQYKVKDNETFIGNMYRFPSFPVVLEVNGVRASLNRAADDRAYTTGDVFNFNGNIGKLLYVNIISPIPTRFNKS